MQQLKSLIQVVPGLPPRVDGIGDYASQLAHRLVTIAGIETSFVVGDPSWVGREAGGFPAVAVTRRSPEALVEAIEGLQASTGRPNTPVLVHFSPYGYQLRGCPFWMAKGLEQWTQTRPGTLNVAFHELEVHSRKPWSSTFWVPRLQRAILRRVAHASTSRYTNTELHRRRLEAWGAGRINLIPNFSTMGEPIDNPPFAGRQRDLVIFGRAAQRRWTYERGARALETLCQQLQIERIIDIGQPIPAEKPAALGSIPIVRCGRLESHEVNTWMATSIGSFQYYPIPFLTKSSVHAVSCAHGCIPFVFDDAPIERSCPGLVTGEDFIPVQNRARGSMTQSLETLSSTVHRNYRLRDSAHAARQLMARLNVHSGTF